MSSVGWTLTDMTLPVKSLCGDNSGLPLRGVSVRRKPCLSAAWPDQSLKRERRRAICSWSVGYGTLNEGEEGSKVADSASLLESRGRRLANNLPIPHAPASVPNSRRNRTFLGMPGIKALVSRRRNSGTTTEPSAPLVRRNGSNGNLLRPAVSLANLRKCETVLALTSVLRSSSSSSLEPMQAVNRLRVSQQESNSRLCSRCSSLLTLASTSRYSLDTNTGGFVQVPDEPSSLLCKLCLVEVPFKDACYIQQCIVPSV